MLEDQVRQLKDSLGSRFKWIDPRQRSKEIAGQVVKNFIERTRDPQVLYEAKRAVIEEIIELNKSPRVYIQTNPPVNVASLKEHSMVEVFGWAEQGANIEINGEKVILNDQGLFLRNLRLSIDDNRVVIDVRKDNGHKRIVREFVVE
jgi:hypothetical protein